MTSEDALTERVDGGGEGPKRNDCVRHLAERFCATPLPEGACADLCATMPDYPYPRSGTNLLTVAQAEQMLRALLDPRAFPDAADGRPASDMAVEIWAAGADHDTAVFVARMLTDRGFVLAPRSPATDAPDGPAQADRDFAGDIWADVFGQPAPRIHDGIAATILEGIATAAARHRHAAEAPLREEIARLREGLVQLADDAEAELCQHENTHRGGAIWTIYDDCYRKWADDRGGFKPYETPAYIRRARALLERTGQ